MAAIKLPASAGEFVVDVLVDEEDADRLGGRKLSIGSHGYAQMWECPKVMLLHRWIMRVPHGTGYRCIVDHVNRDILDCRRENLRIVTPSESNLNREVRERDLPRGVYRTRQGRYHAHIKRHRVVHHLGTYSTPEEAALAVEAARERLDAQAFAGDRPDFGKPAA